MNRSAHNFSKRYGPAALVTGASDGIGAALATELAARGLNLIITARRADRLEALATSLRSDHGVEVLVVPVDLGINQGPDNLVDATSGQDIGLYVACAGFGTAGRFIDNSASEELNMIDVNCHAMTAVLHPLARQMAARRRGGIILMSSIVAFQGVGNSANYAATKAYVQTLAEGLAAELTSSGVDVLASAPGPVETGFATRADMQMGGAATPQTIAKATLQALGRTVTTRPGAQSKMLGYSLAMLPRRLRSRILGQIMQGMTKHRDANKEKTTA
ncbi:MAG: SDR family NAD(P)-dependent oxidoreductase [Rhodobiaceae bacterium]|nr:SDR family NAD(P)-dependent oxidoreductase [Rhodobiaceae bacterium]